jgi:hypothetical protein
VGLVAFPGPQMRGTRGTQFSGRESEKKPMEWAWLLSQVSEARPGAPGLCDWDSGKRPWRSAWLLSLVSEARPGAPELCDWDSGKRPWRSAWLLSQVSEARPGAPELCDWDSGKRPWRSAWLLSLVPKSEGPGAPGLLCFPRSQNRDLGHPWTWLGKGLRGVIPAGAIPAGVIPAGVIPSNSGEIDFDLLGVGVEFGDFEGAHLTLAHGFGFGDSGMSLALPASFQLR